MRRTPPSLFMLRIPGPFVVLQGIPGDGMCNTMDLVPLIPPPPPPPPSVSPSCPPPTAAGKQGASGPTAASTNSPPPPPPTTGGSGGSTAAAAAAAAASTDNLVSATAWMEGMDDPGDIQMENGLQQQQQQPELCGNEAPSEPTGANTTTPTIATAAVVSFSSPRMAFGGDKHMEQAVAVAVVRKDEHSSSSSISVVPEQTAVFNHHRVEENDTFSAWNFHSTAAAAAAAAALIGEGDAATAVSDRDESMNHDARSEDDDDDTPTTSDSDDDEGISTEQTPEESHQHVPNDENNDYVNGATAMTLTEDDDRRRQSILREWRDECREQELFHQREWYEATVTETPICVSDFLASNQLLLPFHNSNNINNSNSNTTAIYTEDERQSGTVSATTTPWWLSDDGCLLLLQSLPVSGCRSLVAVGQLSPGTVVMATELITRSSTDLVTRIGDEYTTTTTTTTITTFPRNDEIENGVEASEAKYGSTTVYLSGRSGWIQFLKIKSPFVGTREEYCYCVLSIDGYSFLGSGMPALYTAPSDQWYWRITFLEGAYVRSGLELASEQLGILPFGTLVRVQRKTINAMGLSRLQIEAVIYSHNKNPTTTLINGWISEFLNPLSGQRGSIARPVPFPVPALYQVTLKGGAVIRGGVELTSPEVRHAAEGTILSITGRVFSENPRGKCVARYQLAGNEGWLSVRLNLENPLDKEVVKFLEIDRSFDPDHAGAFHLTALDRIRDESPLPTDAMPQITFQRRNEEGNEDTQSQDLMAIPMDEAEGSTLHASPNMATDRWFSRRRNQQQKSNNMFDNDDKCLICLCESRTATIVHGETGHVACCLVCARILKARGDPCPVCRFPIDLVVQHFWA